MAKTVIRNGISYFSHECSFCGQEILEIKPKQKIPINYCNYCKNHSIWITKPKTERILFELQEKYIAGLDLTTFKLYAIEIKKLRSEQDFEIIEKHKSNMNQQVLGQMYQIVQNYVGSLLKKYIKRKAFFLPNDEFTDKVYEITYRWYAQFTRKPGFKIEGSWAGFLKWKIIEVLYDKKAVEESQTLSLDYVGNSFTDEKRTLLEREGTHLKGLSTNEINDPYASSINLTNELRKVFILLINAMNQVSKQDSILSLLAFLFFLKKDRKRERSLYDLYGNTIRDNHEKIKLTFREYLRDIYA